MKPSDFPGLVLDENETLVGPPACALFSADRTYRYALTRTWDPALPAAVFIMLNPSIADAFILDPTIRRCRGFAQTWNCGGLTVLNAFALRATKPAAMRGHPDPVGPANDQVIATVLAARTPGPVIVAWGSDSTLQRSGRGSRIVDLLHAGGIEPQCLGQTRAGYPMHPLYRPRHTVLTPYPTADAYAQAQKQEAG